MFVISMNSTAAAENLVRSVSDYHREAAGPNASPYEPAVTMIAALSALHCGPGRWTWLGPLNDRPKDVSFEVAIAQHVGLWPFEQSNEPGVLEPISQDEAKALLASIALDGLQDRYLGRPPPQPFSGLLLALEEGFAPFGADMRCFTSGDHHLAAAGKPQTRGSMSLTRSSFDTGVIGHDGRVGFVFWVDWED